MLAILVDKDCYEVAIPLTGEGSLYEFHGTYYWREYLGRDIDGDRTYSTNHGVRLPKGTIKSWLGRDLDKGCEPIRINENESYKENLDA